ncbi:MULTISPECIES: TrkH family potassium uptake protein [unclassified Roseitalea]|uniref:TrkH family potassium uptake protein n=2 Tax=Roseitalea TaxID=1915401 RepID=UPI00273F40A9|nr:MULTISPECIES: TrkH family potassium uptake protein [unclassified Roseitalea]
MNANMLRSAVHVSAVFAFYLATMMLIPGLVDLYYDNEDWKVFASSAAMIGGLSALVAVATRSGPPVVSTRFTFLVVNMLWLTFSAAAAVPFAFSTLQLSLADAFFEAVSGATATGSTVLTGLDTMPPGILLWRSMLQWIGGLGVIVLGLFILPFLKIGGSTFFKIESSDRYDRPFARFSTYAYSVVGIYASLTVLCAILYAWSGMSGFDAINHAMTTLASGGFSTHDRSFAYFTNPWTHWIAIVFMLIAALPFTALILLALRARFDAFRDNQVLVFLCYTLFLAVLLSMQLDLSDTIAFREGFTSAVFTVVAIVTTTGYAVDNYMQWNAFTVALILVATVLGGCAGSTTGGIKTTRWIILYGVIKRSLETFIYPHAIRTVRSGSLSIPDQTQYVTMMYFGTFFLLAGIITVLVAMTGADLVTAVSGSLTALSNVGPGLGPVIGPVGNFGPLEESAKWILAFGMLLGRLELFTVLVLLSPAFWRD